MLDLDIRNHRPLREVVYEELKMQILTGKIEPGTRMMEVELADAMGVSRTPIREAIRKLEREGLVIIEPRRGAYASQVSVKDMVEILEVRENIEALAAKFAATRMEKDLKEKLEGIADAYKTAVETGDAAGMIENDTTFHHLIVEGSDNKILVSVEEQLQELVLRFRYIYYDDFRRAEKIPMEHKAIIDAIVAEDPEGAWNAAGQHVVQLKEIVESDHALNRQ